MASLRDIIDAALDKGLSKSEIKEILAKKGYSPNEINKAFADDAQQGAETKESDLNYMSRLGMIFSNPSKFFSSVREGSIKNSFLLYLYTSLVFAVLGIAIVFLLSMNSYGRSSYLSPFGYMGLFGIGFSVFFLIFNIVGLFVYAGIVHGVAKMCGGKGSYADSFSACAYSLIPLVMISSIIPLMGWLSIIYSIVLMTIGLSIYHDISKGKAVICALTPVLILIALFALFIIYIVYALSAAF